jgi:hypothetical protein
LVKASRGLDLEDTSRFHLLGGDQSRESLSSGGTKLNYTG